MASSSRSRWAFALAAPLFVMLTTLISSCVTLYDLDGFRGAISALCERAGCDPEFYPSCVESASQRLEDASPEEREAFLRNFTDSGCLEDCPAAQACIDSPPICVGPTSSCTVEAECCGFYKSGNLCGPNGCCQFNGVVCTRDQDCCGGACLEVGDERRCGGIECASLGEACTERRPCCNTELSCDGETRTCVPCKEDGNDCLLATDCCSGLCDRPDPDRAGTCAPSSCGQEDATRCDDPSQCCGGHCVFSALAGTSYCNSLACLPDTILCELDTDCCSGLCFNNVCTDSSQCTAYPGEECQFVSQCCDSVCSDITQTCCIQPGFECSANGTCCDGAVCEFDPMLVTTVCVDASCTADMSFCQDDDACCSTKCDKAEEICCPTFPPCAHGVCALDGEPLKPECSEGVMDPSTPDQFPPFGGPDCIQHVCDTPGYAYCCCSKWDSKCRDQVKASPDFCNAACTDAAPLP